MFEEGLLGKGGRRHRKLIRSINRIALLKLRIRFSLYPMLVGISEKCRWTTLRILYGSNIAKYTSLIPPFGFLVIYNEKVSEILALENMPSSCGLIEKVPYFDNRTDIFFLGLVLVGIASILYRLFAPQEIKLHPNGHKFATAKMSAGNFEIVDCAQQVGLQALKHSKYQAKHKLIGKNHERKRLSLLNKYCSTSFPSSAYSRFISITGIIAKEVRSNTSEYDGRFRAIVCGLDDKFHLDNRDRKRIGKIDLVHKMGRLLKRNAMGKDLILLKDQIGYDLFNLSYLLSNCSGFFKRILIVAVLTVGFTLVAIPTVMTAVYAVDKLC